MHTASVWQPIVHAEDELQENGQIPRGPPISSRGTAMESCVELMARSAAPGAAAACPTDTMAGMAIKTNAKIHIHFELFARVMSIRSFREGVDMVAVVAALESCAASQIERLSPSAQNLGAIHNTCAQEFRSAAAAPSTQPGDRDARQQRHRQRAVVAEAESYDPQRLRPRCDHRTAPACRENLTTTQVQRLTRNVLEAFPLRGEPASHRRPRAPRLSSGTELHLRPFQPARPAHRSAQDGCTTYHDGCAIAAQPRLTKIGADAGAAAAV